MVLPNEEVRRVYAGEILNRIAGAWQAFDLEAQVKARRGLLRGEPGAFIGVVRKILEQSASYHDTGKRHEDFYHGLVLGLACVFFASHFVRSNRESGKGRYDIAMFPKPEARAQIGVIMEFKHTEDESQLDAEAQQALEQIAAKDYIRELSAQGIGTVWRYGLAFCGKRVEVRSEA